MNVDMQPTGFGMDRREALRRVAALMGGLSASTVTGVLAGCGIQESAGPFVPQTLTGDRYELVATLAERILPATDTPGAREARVHEFIDTMLSEWYEEEERARFMEGLSSLNERAKAMAGREFLTLTEQDQRAVLVDLDSEAYGDAPNESAAFIRDLKALTLLGYYTSKVGGTQELRQMPMGAYRGDVPLDEIGRAWA